MKRLVSILICATLLLSLAGAASAAQTTPDGIDISEFVSLKMILLGDKPADYDLVYGAINELAKKDLNCEISVSFMPLSDYQTKYALTLASGEPLDLIYAAPWAYYAAEAEKGAFLEITQEMLEKYMPLTYANQNMVWYDQAKVQGKTYFVSANLANIVGYAILFRDDLRTKYDLDPVTDITTLEAYFDAIAQNEKGIYPYAITQHNDLLKIILFNNAHDIISIQGSETVDYFCYKYEPGKAITSADISWIPDTPEYLEYATKMKEWADKGYWSKNAIADTSAVRDAFENGTSASFVQNVGTLGVSAKTLESKGMTPEAADIYPDAYRFFGLYTGDGIAVAANSKNPERALMLLDKLKMDKEYFELMRFGVEGVHWTAVGDTQYSIDDPDAQQRYIFGGTSWGIKNVMYERTRVDQFKTTTDIYERWKADGVQSPTVEFVFDTSSIQNEMTNLTNLRAKHMYLIDLGLAGDPEAAIAAYTKAAKTAGLDKIMAELARQLDEYFAAH